MAERIDKDDLEAALSVRQELGPSYEPAVIDAFAEKVEAVIDSHVERRLHVERRGERADHSERLASTSLAIISVVAGIPITAISGALTDLPGVMVAWAGIVGVNWAHAFSARNRRGPDGRGSR